MNSLPEPNDGTRPSRLDLARYVTDEMADDEQAKINEWVESHPEQARLALDNLHPAHDVVAPFDVEAIRARARILMNEEGSMDLGANRNNRSAWSNWTRWAAGLAVAAVALFVVMANPGPTIDSHTPAYTIKSGGAVSAFHREGDELVPYDGRQLGEGDHVGFRVRATRFETVSLLSVDGHGTVTVFMGEDLPIPLTRDSVMDLPGTVILDDAPGPELFIVVFDRDPTKAARQLEDTWNRGGHAAVVDLVEHADHLDGMVVERR